MEFDFASNWPVLLVALALILIVLGLIRKLVKLAIVGVAVAVIALVVWPMVANAT